MKKNRIFMTNRMVSALAAIKNPKAPESLIIKKMFKPTMTKSEMMFKFLRKGWFCAVRMRESFMIFKKYKYLSLY